MRYFFDLVDQAGENPDTEGLELGTFDQMRSEAWRALCDIAAEEHARPAGTELSLRVRDGTNRNILQVTLSIKEREIPH